jgi:hypothetical protein
MYEAFRLRGGKGGGVGGRRGMAVWGALLYLIVASYMRGHLAALLPYVSRMRGAKAQ